MAMNEYLATVGGELARQWHLPKQVEESIEHYRDYAAAPSFGKVAAMVNLASQLASILVCTDDSEMSEDVEDIARLQVSRDIGLSADDVKSLVAETGQIRHIVQSML